MNPGIVTAAVVVVGAIAAALCYVFDQQPTVRQHNGNNYNYNYNHYSTNNYYPSDTSSGTRTVSRNRKKEKQVVNMMNSCCTICLEDLIGEIEILPCNHAFHVSCMKDFETKTPQSATGKRHCPNCREEFD